MNNEASKNYQGKISRNSEGKLEIDLEGERSNSLTDCLSEIFSSKSGINILSGKSGLKLRITSSGALSHHAIRYEVHAEPLNCEDPYISKARILENIKASDRARPGYTNGKSLRFLFDNRNIIYLEGLKS